MFKYFIGAFAAVAVIGMAETVVNEWKADKHAKRRIMEEEADARAEAIRKGKAVPEVK